LGIRIVLPKKAKAKIDNHLSALNIIKKSNKNPNLSLKTNKKKKINRRQKIQKTLKNKNRKKTLP
jgi:hypothetical protein